jgi:hypothetical protein
MWECSDWQAHRSDPDGEQERDEPEEVQGANGATRRLERTTRIEPFPRVAVYQVRPVGRVRFVVIFDCGTTLGAVRGIVVKL